MRLKNKRSLVKLALQVPLISSCVAVAVATAWASTLIDHSQLQNTTIKVTKNGALVDQNIFCYRGAAGLAKARGSQYQFTSYAESIRSLKKSNPQSKKIAQYRAINKVAGPACKALPILPTPTKTPGGGSPTPGGQATPTPRPTSTPQSGNFDSSGNVTAQGKITFQIPSNLSANISRGKTVFNGFCTGCHEERVNRSYPNIDASIRLSPMLYDDSQISSAQRADLVAYLNRFRP